MKRNKSNIEIHFGILDFYKSYKRKSLNPVNKGVYSSIVKEINESISNAMIYTGYEFEMPNIKFSISIAKKKHKIKFDESGNPIIKWLPVDYQETKKLWNKLYPDKTEEEILKIPDRPRVYNRNKHSNGYVYRWYFNRILSNCVNQSVYYFEPTRTNRRNLAKYIQSEDFVDRYYEHL